MILVVSLNWRPLVLSTFLLSTVWASSSSEYNDLNNLTNNNTETYKVFRIFPGSWADIDAISALRSMSEDDEVDFWLDSRQPGQFADVMVSPRIQATVRDWLIERKLRFRITINDVAKLIYQHEHSQKSIQKSSKYKTSHSSSSSHPESAETSKESDELLQRANRLRDAPIEVDAEGAKFGERPYEYVRKVKGFNYPFGEYTNYATMLKYMRTIEFYYPHLAKLIRIGVTHEGRPIEGLRIGYHVSNTTKRHFWIDGNVHAREWASGHTALFIINQLISNYGKDPIITHYMNNINFLIVPCLNPDGYEYSRSSMNPEIRLWRKNRSPEKCVTSKWGGERCCQGVDLNRNFDFHWAESGSSTNPCSNLYAGESVFSEPEADAVNQFLNLPEYKKNVDGFITLHTYAQLWIHPFSHEVEYYPNDVNRLTSVARRAVERLSSVYGTQFRIGTGADLLSPAAGGSDDWAKEVLEIRYVYLVELRPQLELSRGFILNKEELVPTAIETFEGIKVVIEEVLVDNGIKPRPAIPQKQSGQTAPRILSAPVYNTQEKPSESLLVPEKFTNGRFAAIPEVRPTPYVLREDSDEKQMESNWLKANLSPEYTLPLSESTVQFTEPTTTTPQTTPTTTTESTTTKEQTTPPSTTERTTTTEQTTATESTTTEQTTATESTTTKEPTTTPQLTTTTEQTTTTTESTTTTEEAPKTTEELTTPSKLQPSTTESSTAKVIDVEGALENSPDAVTTQPPVSTTTIAETMAKRLTQELLRKQLLRLQALKSIRQNIKDRIATTSAPHVLQAPRFLTSAPMSVLMSMNKSDDLNSSTGAQGNQLKLIPKPKCADKKYSCTFWIKADKHVCEDQQRFMKINCARSCKFCE